MSGIYIPGMEMPTSCFQCEFRTKIDPDNLMCIISQKTFEERFYHIEHRDESCPLISVPEHGRLIDADAMSQDETVAFISAQEKLGHDVVSWQVNTIVHAKIQKLIDDTPTIIPADPAEEEER